MSIFYTQLMKLVILQKNKHPHISFTFTFFNLPENFDFVNHSFSNLYAIFLIPALLPALKKRKDVPGNGCVKQFCHLHPFCSLAQDPHQFCYHRFRCHIVGFQYWQILLDTVTYMVNRQVTALVFHLRSQHPVFLTGAHLSCAL